MSGRANRWSALVLASMLVGVSLVGLTATAASAASTTVTNVHWTKPRLEVGTKAKKSNLKVTLADRDGVCSAAVGVSGPKGRYFTRSLYLDSGSNTRGTFSTGSEAWYLSERGTWRVTVVVVIDCDGHTYMRKQKSGIGGKLKVFTSKKVSKLKLTSVPGSLTRGVRDTATVKLTAGGKKVKKATVRLIACDDDTYADCWRVGSAKTNKQGVAKVKYTMPRQDVLLFASYKGSKANTYGYSSDRYVAVKWRTVTVGLTLTVSPGTAASYDGSGTATVRLSRTVCDGTVELQGDVTGYAFISGCTRTVTFDLAEPNYEDGPVVLRFSAVLDADGYDLEDSYTGRSGTASFTVPGFVI